ncbi:phage minor head protein [Moraxella equi]|uniref:Phage head morphogenesis protein, SPP1 gp7 family n=1 Tax=Moraxella equi TaxID=60442 RepID=A0A378QPR3_9GAMM|nr:phage minor head protein [Moraxella equi]OPH34972.1 hypothetical protein B5J93_11485 [Moraxella equi]STZ02855.1 phage head morphogenesis protein, SPP1 gp7 family [Moraxella equi]
MTKISGQRLPFQEQIDFLRQKVRVPTATYKDLTQAQHDKAFTVAGAMKADLLADLHNAIQKAVAGGQAFHEFQANFDDILVKKGWLNDKDKDYKAWRAKVIYQTNLRTSHMAGRYKQMTDPDVLKARPYWRYRHNTVENPRHQHKSWDGLVLPADSPFWQTNYPPNGWGCRCTVEAINERELKRMGKEKPDELPANYADNVGESFDGVAGASWFPDVDKYPYQVAKSFVADNMRDGVFIRWLSRIENQLDDYKKDTPDYDKLPKQERIDGFRELDQKESYPVAVLSPDQMQMLGVSTQTVLFSENDALKQAISRDGNTGFEPTDYYYVQYLLDNAVLIVREYDKKNNRYRQQTTWVEGIRDDGKRYLAIIHQTADGAGVYLKSYRLDSSKDEKLKNKGVVLFEK